MPRLYVKVVGLPYAKMWNKQLHAYDAETVCHLLRIVISFRRFSHTSRRHNASCFQYVEMEKLQFAANLRIIS